MAEEQPDPVIDEIRDNRQRISARFDHDPARLGAYYIGLQEQYRNRLITLPKARADATIPPLVADPDQ